MKETLIAAAAAALFVAALWFGLKLMPPAVPGQSAGGLAAVDAGFVGQKKFGPWVLNCPQPKNTTPANSATPAFSLTPGHGSPLPAPPDASSTNAASSENSLGRCRTILPFFNNNKQVVMIVGFRTMGATDTLAMIIRFPLIAKKGDDVIVKAGKSGFKLPVYDCQSSVCVAAGQLGTPAEQLLMSTKEAVLLFPVGADGKRHGTRVPLGGMAAAVSSMRKAQNS